MKEPRALYVGSLVYWGNLIVFFSFSGLRDEDWGGQLVVTMEDFNSALETLQLSVSAAELAKYKELHLSLTQTNTHSTSTAY